MKHLKTFSTALALACAAAFTLAAAPAQATSLWAQAGTSAKNPIAAKKSNARGDIITVIIDESMTQSVNLQTTTSKDASIQNQVGQFLFSAAASGFGSHNGELPATDITGSNNYSGGGALTNSQTLQGRITVTVIDILPNGYLVIEGSRRIQNAGETQFAVLRGVVRPWDITNANTISTTQIAQLELEITSEGTLTRAQSKGWLQKINDWVNPF